MAPDSHGEESSDTWESNRLLMRYTLDELKRRDRDILHKIEALSLSMVASKMDLASLKARSGVYGLLGGMVPVLIALAMALLSGLNK